MENNKMETFFINGFTENSYFNIVKNFVNHFHTDNEYNAGKQLNFLYSTSDDVNASASQDGVGKDYMTLNAGTLVRVYTHMKNVFANKHFFTMLGDATNERGEDREVIRGWFNEPLRRLEFLGNPVDDRRRYLADMCALFALRFICTHELGHIYNGHTELLKSVYALPVSEMIVKRYLFEHNVPKVMETYALDRRTLEMDADAFAATASMMNISEIYMQKDDKEWSEMYGDGLPNSALLFRLWAFSIQSIFLIFQMEVKVDYSRVAFYLPNEARSVMAFSAALETLNGLRTNGIFTCSEEEMSEIMENIFSGIEEANQYFNAIHFTHFSLRQNMDKYIAFSAEVHMHWEKELRNKLEKYARIALYNPATINDEFKRIKR